MREKEATPVLIQGVRCPCGVCGVVGRTTSVALMRGTSRRPFGWRNENSSLHVWRHKNEHIHKSPKRILSGEA